MAVLIKEKKQARKLALNFASKLLEHHIPTLPTEHFDENSSALVRQELEQIAKHLAKRASNIEAEWEEV